MQMRVLTPDCLLLRYTTHRLARLVHRALRCSLSLLGMAPARLYIRVISLAFPPLLVPRRWPWCCFPF